MKPTILSAACTLIAATGAALALAATPADAQDYPSKPIRLIVPVPPGVGPDVDSRFVAARIAGVLGQPMVIENRPGAATRIAIDAAVKSAPDGYTLLLGTPSMTTAPSLYANLPFDAKRDLVPVSLLSVTPYALTVNAAVPAKTVKDFVALTKSDPSFSNVATLGLGTIPHLTGAWFAAVSGAQPSFVHYNTSPPFNDLSAGRASAIFDALLPVLGNIKSGKLRVLAVSGKQRNAMLPDVPTFAEAGFAEFDPMVWVGILAPAGTPPAIVKRLSAAFAEVARMPEIVEHRAKVGSDSIGSTPEEFAAFLDAERAKWGGVIKSLGIKLQ